MEGGEDVSFRSLMIYIYSPWGDDDDDDENLELTKSVVDAHSPCHTLLTLDGREDFCRILECNRTFSQRVCDREQVHEKHDGSDLRSFGCRVGN